MALILAINPGNSHSPTLARLARELQGCELIGADSCAVAITAINKRVPDLVLLPERPARGEADLLARLRAIPGGVLTLKLPPVSSADPVAIAKDIRTMLAGETAAQAPAPVRAPAPAPVRAPAPKVSGPSPHLVAAAKAMIDWMHTRQAQWAEAERLHLAPEPLPVSASAGTAEPHEPYEPHEPLEHDMFGPAEPASGTWLPRAAIVAALVGAGAAGVWLWPSIRGGTSSGVTQVSAPQETAQVESNGPPAATPTSTQPTTAKPGALPADAAAAMAGFVAVFAPFDISISNASQPLTVDDRGRAMLPSGKYRLRFQNREIGYDETRAVEVRPTETTTINLVPRTPLNVTASEAAEVLVDGERTGETPFRGRIPYGAHTVTIRTAGGERQFQIEATMKPVQLEVDFSKP